MLPAPDLDGGGTESQTWWEAPCVDRMHNLYVGMADEVTSISRDH